jgi:hypothetical protein
MYINEGVCLLDFNLDPLIEEHAFASQTYSAKFTQQSTPQHRLQKLKSKTALVLVQ